MQLSQRSLIAGIKFFFDYPANPLRITTFRQQKPLKNEAEIRKSAGVFPLFWKRRHLLGLQAGISPSERIANRHTRARGMPAGELLIVMDEVLAHFRAHEYTSVRVQAYGCSEIAHEVIAADVVRTGVGKVVAGVVLGVKAGAQAAESPEQFKLCMFAQPRRIDGIEIVKNRPIWLISAIQALAGLPCHLTLHPELMPKDVLVETGNSIKSAIGP